MEQTEHPKKHHRGSTPSEGAEQIYHDWIKRNGPTEMSNEHSEGRNDTKPAPAGEPASEIRIVEKALAQDSDGKDAEQDAASLLPPILK